MRRPKVIVAIAGVFWSAGAFACSCVKWDADYLTSRAAIVFLGEVTSVDTAHPEKDPRYGWDNVAFPFSVRAIEKLKGDPDNLRLFLVGPPSACELKLAVGERRIFMLSPGNVYVGWCSVAKPTDDNLGELRAAVNKR